jgi:hypothetical protein
VESLSSRFFTFRRLVPSALMNFLRIHRTSGKKGILVLESLDECDRGERLEQQHRVMAFWRLLAPQQDYLGNVDNNSKMSQIRHRRGSTTQWLYNSARAKKEVAEDDRPDADSFMLSAVPEATAAFIKKREVAAMVWCLHQSSMKRRQKPGGHAAALCESRRMTTSSPPSRNGLRPLSVGP